MLTQERLKELLHYDPDTGVFTWLVNANNNGAQHNCVAGSRTTRGYMVIKINKRAYRRSILAWVYVTGSMPTGQIDHVNGIKDDDRISNLRVATHSQNQHNKQKRVDNASGFKGVSWDSSKRKWRAQIMVNKKQRHLGRFDTASEANLAYVKAAEELVGDFSNFC